MSCRVFPSGFYVEGGEVGKRRKFFFKLGRLKIVPCEICLAREDFG